MITTAGSTGGLVIHAVYRSYGGENRKGRPAYYSKFLALASFVRALERAPIRAVFLNDGPVPEPHLRLMRAAGEVVELPRVGMRRSHFTALRMARGRSLADHDVLYVTEDDYLYQPSALAELGAAVRALPHVDYFSLYGAPPGDDSAGELRTFPPPPGWRPGPPERAGSTTWVNVAACTSTFGARARALREDWWIHRQATLPYRNRVNDFGASVTAQGYEPYRWSDLRAAARLVHQDVDGTPRLKGAGLVPFRAALNLRSRRRASRRRLLYAPQVNLATHMETGWIAPGVDWQQLAEDTLDWVDTRGP